MLLQNLLLQQTKKIVATSESDPNWLDSKPISQFKQVDIELELQLAQLIYQSVTRFIPSVTTFLMILFILLTTL